MSVRPIGSDELSNVYANLRVRQRLVESAGVRQDELGELVLTVHVGNCAAFSMTYGDQLEARKLQVTDKVTKRLTDQELFELLGNLVYNCVSNGGKLFLPQEQWDAVNRLRLAIAWEHFREDTRAKKQRKKSARR